MASNGFLSVESTAEWKIHDILFDGQERYLQPPQFSDHVAKLAHKIEWRDLIGSDTTRDDPEKLVESDNASVTNAANNRGVGPWDQVAKKLYKSLTEMNVLLDVVEVAKGKQYLTLDPVLLCPNVDLADPAQDNANAHAHNTCKTVTYLGKKKALGQASLMILDPLNTCKSNLEGDEEDLKTQDQYLSELIQFRRHCRLKKVGNTILGDIACNTHGPKFLPHCTLQVRRCTDPSKNDGSTLQLQLPTNLKRNSLLKVVLYNPSVNDVTNVTDVVNKQRTHFAWEKTLLNAQHTLLSKDLFQILSRDSVQLQKHVALVNKNEISVKLKFVYYLKIHQVHAGEDVQLQGECVDVLEREMWSDYFARLGDADYSTQLIAGGMPVASTSNLQLKLNGVNSIQQNAMKVNGTKGAILDNLINHASHVLMQKRVTYVLSHLTQTMKDPVLIWHWSRSSNQFSVIKATVYSPPFENPTRFFNSFALELHKSGIVLATRDGDRIECSPDVDNIMYLLKVQAYQQQLHSVSLVLKFGSWQILTCNPQALDSNAKIAPLLLAACNSGTRSLLLRLPFDCEPEVYIQTAGSTGFDSQLMQYSPWNPAGFRGKLTKIDYSSLCGTTLVHKMELLCVALQQAC